MSAFDDLDLFMKWWMATRPIMVPMDNALTFIESAHGIVLYRQPPYQVQLFIAPPSTPIPEHEHPNVDSYEVWLNGMEFTHSGDTVIDLKTATERGEDGFSPHFGQVIRVKPNDKHGGVGSARGGAFLSIQKWNNGVPPTCVASDWKGQSGGKVHASKITSGSLS